MDYIESVDKVSLDQLQPIAESDLFAIYAVGEQTYLLVQRHQGTPWMALRLSGDGLFRVSSLLGEAARHLYRQVASRLSPNHAIDHVRGTKVTSASGGLSSRAHGERR